MPSAPLPRASGVVIRRKYISASNTQESIPPGQQRNTVHTQPRRKPAVPISIWALTPVGRNARKRLRLSPSTIYRHYANESKEACGVYLVDTDVDSSPLHRHFERRHVYVSASHQVTPRDSAAVENDFLSVGHSGLPCGPQRLVCEAVFVSLGMPQGPTLASPLNTRRISDMDRAQCPQTVLAPKAPEPVRTN